MPKRSSFLNKTYFLWYLWHSLFICRRMFTIHYLKIMGAGIYQQMSYFVIHGVMIFMNIATYILSRFKKIPISLSTLALYTHITFHHHCTYYIIIHHIFFTREVCQVEELEGVSLRVQLLLLSFCGIREIWHTLLVLHSRVVLCSYRMYHYLWRVNKYKLLSKLESIPRSACCRPCM